MSDIKQQIPSSDTPPYSAPTAPTHEQMVVRGDGSQYVHATPLHELTRMSAPVDCPKCGRRSMTATTSKTGGLTHLLGAAVCCTICLGCLPYMMSGAKDVKHKCGSCGELLAVWHRSGGGVDVMAYHMK